MGYKSFISFFIFFWSSYCTEEKNCDICTPKTERGFKSCCFGEGKAVSASELIQQVMREKDFRIAAFFE